MPEVKSSVPKFNKRQQVEQRIARAGLLISMVKVADMKFAEGAAIRLAEYVWHLIGTSANSREFKSNFVDLGQLIGQLEKKRGEILAPQGLKG